MVIERTYASFWGGIACFMIILVYNIGRCKILLLLVTKVKTSASVILRCCLPRISYNFNWAFDSLTAMAKQIAFWDQVMLENGS
jgi:hypothetical protein